MTKQINIACEGAALVPIEQLEIMQGDLKSLSKENHEKLKRAIEKHGFTAPVFVWRGKNKILDGTQRLRTVQQMLKEGFALPDGKLPVCWIGAKNLKEAKEILLDFVSQYGEIDSQGLYEFLMTGEPLDFEEIKLEIDLPEIDLAEFEAEYFESEPPEEPPIPEPPKNPICKPGELWLLDKHRLLCGDATKREDVERLMDGKKADMLFTDPPYGLGGYGGRKNMPLMGDDGNCEKFYACLPHLPEMYVWGLFWTLPLLNFQPRDAIIWAKNNFGLGTGYRGQYEVCFYSGAFAGSDSDLWEQAKDVALQHPTQKPIELCMRAIKNSEPKIVLDLFLGSGSTLIACEQLNRICYGTEIDPCYCDVILNRWATYTGKDPVREDGVKWSSLQEIPPEAPQI